MSKYRDKRLTNIYNVLPKECKSQAILNYENREIYKIDIPCRIAIVGQTGSGKTHFILNMLDRLNAFSRFYIWAKDIQEPLYRYLLIKLHHIEKQKGEKLVFFSNRLSNLPRPEDLDVKYSNIIIIDDMLGEKIKELDKVAKLAVYARHTNTSLCMVSQSYYYLPKLLRDQVNYCWIKKHNSVKRLKQVINQFSGGTKYTEKELLAIYEELIKDPMNALLFDIQTIDDKYKVRMNFTPIEETGLVPKAMANIMVKNQKYRQEEINSKCVVKNISSDIKEDVKPVLQPSSV